MTTMKRKTIKDIAKESGFSLSTVSLVLNNHPRISQATRDRVLAVVKKYNFYPNSAARGLASKSSKTLSVVVPNLTRVFSDIYLGEIISGIYERATSQGYKILLDIATSQFIKTQEYTKLLASRRADGMLFIASDIHADYLSVFEDSPFKFLLVNHVFPGKKLNYVSVDYAASARLAAEHLLGLGHRKIGLIAGTNTFTGLQFRDEFLRVCKAWPAGAAQVTWVDGGEEWSQRGGYAAGAKLMAQAPNLTAIMAANDRMALGAMRWLADNRREVPEDISVMGFDNLDFSSMTDPPLTTVAQPFYEMGVRACQRLIQLIEKGRTAKAKAKIDVLPAELVIRKSVR